MCDLLLERVGGWTRVSGWLATLWLAAISLATLSLATLPLVGCTDASLTQSVPFSRHGFTGKIAAPPPLQEVPPTFILYVADISYSTIISDPNGLRQQGFANLVNAYRANSNVYYGIMTFSDAAYMQTLNFTNDFNLLLSASTNLNNNLDGGNFSDTLLQIFNFLDRSIKTQSVQQAQLSQYYVYFISTGIPNIGLSDPNSIFPFVEGITTSVAPRVRHFEFDTAFLSYLPSTAPPTVQAAYAQSLATLSGMAEAGQGRLETLTLTPPNVANIGINLDPIDREFSLQRVYVTNINSGWDENGPTVDSDADGLVDLAEKLLGTDIANPDTDGDGYRDGIEAHFPNTMNPLKKDAGCINPGADSDQDHLLDCEETLYGTSVVDPDSNNNYILDGDEVLQGALPTSTVSTRDIDQDGYTDEQEILAHTAVTLTTPGSTMQTFGYTYVRDTTAASAAQPQTTSLNSANVSLFETVAVGSAKAGTNTARLVLAFAPDDGAGPVQFYEATQQATYFAATDSTDADSAWPFNAQSLRALPLAKP